MLSSFFYFEYRLSQPLAERSHSTKKYYFEHSVSCIISYNISIYHILLSSFSILNIVSANRWRTTAGERLFQREILTTGDNNGLDQRTEVRFVSIYKIYCKGECRPFIVDNICLSFFSTEKGWTSIILLKVF